MAWNGSGTFSRTNGVHTGSTTWVQDRDAGAYILASRHDTHDQDLADGIGACLTKNGETKPTADFKPNADNTYDLGSTALRWAEAHALKFQVEANFHLSFLSATAAQLLFDAGDAILYDRTANNLSGYIGSAQVWADSGAGRYAVDGTALLPAWSFLNDTDCGFYRIGANNIGLALNATKYFDFLTTGLTVVGTASSIPMAAFADTPVTMTAGYTNTNLVATKDSHGRVHLAGVANKDSSASGALTYFTLAAGYRPARTVKKYIRNETDGAVYCVVNTDGTVVVTHGTSQSANTAFDLSFATT